MSGSQSAIFGGGSRWISNPKHLPLAIINEASLFLKTALAVTNTFSSANAATSFTAMALRGAQASVSVADTYVTLTDLTGGGFLFNVICACNTGAVYTPTLRITVDGVAYTITTSSTVTASYRMVLGALTSGTPATSAIGAVGTDIIGPNDASDTGFANANIGGLYNPSIAGIVTPETLLAYGMPCLRFEVSLKVEMKTSLLASAAGDKIGGVTYRLDV